jgi:hypothetical protein
LIRKLERADATIAVLRSRSPPSAARCNFNLAN